MSLDSALRFRASGGQYIVTDPWLLKLLTRAHQLHATCRDKLGQNPEVDKSKNWSIHVGRKPPEEKWRC